MTVNPCCGSVGECDGPSNPDHIDFIHPESWYDLVQSVENGRPAYCYDGDQIFAALQIDEDSAVVAYRDREGLNKNIQLWRVYALAELLIPSDDWIADRVSEEEVAEAVASIVGKGRALGEVRWHTRARVTRVRDA